MEGGSFAFEAFEYEKDYFLWKMLGNLWALRVSCRASSKEAMFQIVRNSPGNVLKVTLDCVFTKYSDGKELLEVTCEHTFEENEFCYKFHINHCGMMRDHIGDLKGHIKVCAVETETDKRRKMRLQFEDMLANLRRLAPCSVCRDVDSMFLQQNYCDTSLVCNSVKLGVHKAILSARSPVFARQFESRLEKDQMIIHGLEEGEFTEIIKFIYTGKVKELNFDLARGLFVGACRYALQDLKDLCVCYLVTNVTEENVVRILDLAEKYENNHLKESAKDFICDHLAAVSSSAEWKKFSKRSYLAIEVLNSAVLKLKCDE